MMGRDISPRQMSVADEEVLPQPWYLVYTKPRLESEAQRQLQRQAFEVYLPLYKKLKRTSEGIVAVREPMFPRYLFVRPAGPAQSLSSVRSTRGVSTLVRFGFEPAVVASTLIEAVRTMEREREDAELGALNSLEVGQRVRLAHVAMHDMEGLVQAVSSKRVQVLLEILGRPVSVQLEHHQIQPAP